MERKKVIISSVVGFLGLLSASMAFASEAKRIKPSQIMFSDTGTDDGINCTYPSIALPLGLALGAAVAIVLAQIVVSAATGCFCIRRGSYRPNTKWALGLICFIFSWVAFANGLRLLLSGAVVTGQRHNDSLQVNGVVFIPCIIYGVRPGCFAGGGILSLVTVALSVVGYLVWDSAEETIDNPAGETAAGGTAVAAPPNYYPGGVAMGQYPKFPSTEYPQP